MLSTAHSAHVTDSCTHTQLYIRRTLFPSACELSVPLVRAALLLELRLGCFFHIAERGAPSILSLLWSCPFCALCYDHQHEHLCPLFGLGIAGYPHRLLRGGKGGVNSQTGACGRHGTLVRHVMHVMYVMHVIHVMHVMRSVLFCVTTGLCFTCVLLLYRCSVCCALHCFTGVKMWIVKV